MKAKPCILIPGKGYVPCAAAEATHLTLNLPGPSGRLTLPVQIRGTREGTGNWTWNGDTERPTLRPSVLTTGGRGNWRCHSWITEGAAIYLDDSSHDLRGQAVGLLEVDNE